MVSVDFGLITKAAQLRLGSDKGPGGVDLDFGLCRSQPSAGAGFLIGWRLG